MTRKHREIFVSGHYLLLDAKLWASRNRSYPRTNIRAYFRANYWLLCLSSFKYFTTLMKKSLQIAYCFLLEICIFLSFLSYAFMRKQMFPFFCNNHITLSHLELNIRSWRQVWKSGNITRVISSDIHSFSWGIFGHVLYEDQLRASKKYLMDHKTKLWRMY